MRLTVDEDGDPVESQPAVEAAKKVIKNLTKSYKPDLYPNPSMSFVPLVESGGILTDSLEMAKIGLSYHYEVSLVIS